MLFFGSVHKLVWCRLPKHKAQGRWNVINLLHHFTIFVCVLIYKGQRLLYTNTHFIKHSTSFPASQLFQSQWVTANIYHYNLFQRKIPPNDNTTYFIATEISSLHFDKNGWNVPQYNNMTTSVKTLHVT